MYYRHKLDFQYPDRSDQHMITVKHLRDVNLDESYPYLQKGFWYGCKRAFYWVAMNALVFWVCRVRHGLRIYGRKNLREHKELLKNGAITVSNHVFMWDFICVLDALRPRLTNFPAWATNLEGPNGPLIRLSGGIPIPTENHRAMGKFHKAISDVLTSKKWLHFYPEGSMWYYYPDIRPLKKAVFKYAVQYDRPIIPITMSFRPAGPIRRLFTDRPPVDLHVGKPMLHDKSLERSDAIDKLHRDVYHVMQTMVGVNPGDTTYNTDQNIDSYIKTM